MGTSHEEVWKFTIIFHSVRVKMRNVSDTIYRENQNTIFTFNNFFLNHIFYDITGRSFVEADRLQMKM
jgi:hypothetical protein